MRWILASLVLSLAQGLLDSTQGQLNRHWHHFNRLDIERRQALRRMLRGTTGSPDEEKLISVDGVYDSLQDQRSHERDSMMASLSSQGARAEVEDAPLIHAAQRHHDLALLTNPTHYILNAGKDGLPISDGKRPSWLLKEDELILDARKVAHGGILIAQPVLMDATGSWGQNKASRPRWLRAILATNRHHARLHGHCIILRWQPTQPQLTKWQKRRCGKTDEKSCTRQNERENFNWEKHLMLYEYLMSPQNFTHVLMLDADAALVKHSVDILGGIAAQMAQRNLDVFLTSEDWLLNGERRINGGFLMTRNSEWSEHLFKDTFRAHVVGPGGLRRWKIGLPHQECSSNEQICLNDIMSGSSLNKKLVKGHMSLESGIIYNRGGCTVKHCGEPTTDPKMEALGMKDERLQVLHFTGSSKYLAPQVLCDDGEDYTGDGPKGYGCHK